MWIQYTCLQYIENRTIPVCGVSRTSQLWIIGLNVFFLRKLTQQGLGLGKKLGFIGCLLMESWLCIDWSRNLFYRRKIWCKEFYTVIMKTLPNENSLLQCLMWFQMQFIFFVFYYSSGKTWNTFIHVSFFAAVCTALYHRVAFFCQSTDVSVQLEALDILGDLLSRFGGT